MKGFELPVNILVIAAVAIIILLTIIALYFTGFNPFSSTVSIESAKNNACSQEVRSDCRTGTSSIRTEGFDADEDGTLGETAANGDNLFMLCQNYYNVGCINKVKGDMNNDCIVEGNDVNIFNAAYGSEVGDSNWNPDADLNGDGSVGRTDYGILAGAFSDTDPATDTACKKLCKCP
jgi:hypothetical protein